MAIAAYSAMEESRSRSFSLKASSLIRLTSSMTPKILSSVFNGVAMIERVLNRVYLSTLLLNLLSFVTSSTTRGLPVSMTYPAMPSPLGSLTPCRRLLLVPTTTEKIMSPVLVSLSRMDQWQGWKMQPT